MILAYLVDTPPPPPAWDPEVGGACRHAAIFASMYNYPVSFEFNEVTLHAYPGELPERIQARYWQSCLEQGVSPSEEYRYVHRIAFLLGKAKEKEDALSVTTPTLSPLRERHNSYEQRWSARVPALSGRVDGQR